MITKILRYWDDQPGCRAGWYVELIDVREQTVDDSEKIWFAVDVSTYSKDERVALDAALGKQYPGVPIE